MVDAGQLEAVEDAGRKRITVYSMDARKAEQPKPGRPKREAAMANGAPAEGGITMGAHPCAEGA
jgi:hypothetical protein